MGGDVHESAGGAVSPQALVAGVLSEETDWVGKDGRYILDFFFDVRSAGVGDSENEGLLLRRCFLGTAQGIHAGARRIGDGVFVHQIPVTVMEGVKRNVMKERVRDDNQMFRLKPISDGGYQVVIQRTKMGLGGFQQARGEAARVIGPERKLGELKLEEAETLVQAVCRRQRDNLKVFPGQQANIEIVLNFVVFQQDSIAGDVGPDGL